MSVLIIFFRLIITAHLMQCIELRNRHHFRDYSSFSLAFSLTDHIIKLRYAHASLLLYQLHDVNLFSRPLVLITIIAVIIEVVE